MPFPFSSHKTLTMKKQLLFTVFSLTVFIGSAQQQESGHDQYLAHQTIEKKTTGKYLRYSLIQPGVAAEMLTGNNNAAAPMFDVINGAGTINFLPKFTPTGIEIGNSQIFDNGTNIGIGTTVPSGKLHIVHATGTTLKLASTAGFSALDIDASTGDAAIRFFKAGASQWMIRNRPADNYLEFFEFGVGTRMVIQDATGNVGIGISTPTAKLHVNGNFTITGIKAFTIDHPLDPENKMLRHFAIESNEVLNSYSGNVVTNEKGIGTVTLPDYFEAINKDFRYQLTVIGSFAQAIINKEISKNSFEIATNQPNVKVSWEVKGVRNDGYMKHVNEMKTEEMKPAKMKGKYIEPKAFNLPESRGVDYNPLNLKEHQSTTTNPVRDNVNRVIDKPGKMVTNPLAKPVGNESSE
jgi:hypothetical protein